MKRNRRSLKLNRETLHALTLTSPNSLGRVGGAIGSVKASCLTEMYGCNTDAPNCSMNQSCPNHCLTEGAGCHSLNTRC